MRNMLRCRRGSVAFATVIALVPLVGVIALGAEAGSWYVTKQHAQTAADAAAYSGGLWLACSLAPSTCTPDAQSMDYRGKQLAAQNTFCNGADATPYPGSRCTSLPSGITRSVSIAAVGADSVQATVTQTQPAYLAQLLGLSTVPIRATAIAKVILLANPCVVALQDQLGFQGSLTVNAPGCGLSSNSKAANAINFTGNTGINIDNAGTISAQGGCSQTGGNQCSKAITYMPPVPNPLSALDPVIASLTKTSFPDGACKNTTTLKDKSYGSGPGNACYYTSFPSGDQTLNGVYFFTGDVKINGSVKISGTATLILLPPKFLSNGDKGATLSISGGPTIQLTALSSVSTTQVPAAMASVVSLLSKLLIYDPEPIPNGQNQSINITGSPSSFFNGITYVPNAVVTYQGSTQNYGCVEVIARGITLSGNSNFDNSQCPPSSKIVSQYVRLLQ